MTTIKSYIRNISAHQKEGRYWSCVDHIDLLSWEQELDKLRSRECIIDSELETAKAYTKRFKSIVNDILDNETLDNETKIALLYFTRGFSLAAIETLGNQIKRMQEAKFNPE